MRDDRADVIDGSIQANEQFTQLPQDDRKCMRFVWITARRGPLEQAPEAGMGEGKMALRIGICASFVGGIVSLLALFLAAILDQAELGVPKGQRRGDVKIGKGSSCFLSVFKGQGGEPNAVLRHRRLLRHTTRCRRIRRVDPRLFAGQDLLQEGVEVRQGRTHGPHRVQVGQQRLTGGTPVPLLSHGGPGDSTTALLIFGFFGWRAVKLGLETARFILGFILGPSAEVHFVKSLESFGDLSIFFTKSWIARRLWVLIAGSLVGSVYLSRRQAKAGASD